MGDDCNTPPFNYSYPLSPTHIIDRKAGFCTLIIEAKDASTQALIAYMIELSDFVFRRK